MASLPFVGSQSLPILSGWLAHTADTHVPRCFWPL